MNGVTGLHSQHDRAEVRQCGLERLAANCQACCCQSRPSSWDSVVLRMGRRGVKVVGIQAFGCFVECLPGQQGLVHVSELDVERTDDPAAKWKLGDAMDVLCLASAGKVKLSR